MPDNSLSQFLSKKAYEISYAIFRVAASSKKRSFMEHLERQGLSFLASAVREDYAVAKEANVAIECLLRFGQDIGIVNPGNAQAIIEEIMAFNSAIAGSEKVETPRVVNLENIFSKLPIIADDDENVGKETVNEDVDKSGNHGAVKAAMRQSAILEKIRQSGNCRLKEIQGTLPGASERTVRYDLQNLLEQGLVERIGSGGPATFYRAK